jgi:hypothetical protein
VTALLAISCIDNFSGGVAREREGLGFRCCQISLCPPRDTSAACGFAGGSPVSRVEPENLADKRRVTGRNEWRKPPISSTVEEKILEDRVKQLYFALAILLLSTAAQAQTVSGSIRGTVADPENAVVAGATVSLTNPLTRQALEFVTDVNGTFVFPNLVPGDYDLRVTNPGFKVFVQNGVHVATNERVDVHTLKLAVGDVTTSVEVQADVVRVATDSSDRGIQINRAQIENTTTIGRSYLDLMRSLPGTQATTTLDAFVGSIGGIGPTINGGRQGQLLSTFDGIINQDATGGGTTGGYAQTSPDAIAEVQVMVSNYPAEYGARNGGLFNVIVKNGSRQFHGSAYYYMRNESLNSNDWFNNANRLPRAKYRYANPGLTFGGPLIVPGTPFNRSRTRLFFFFSEDYLHNENVSNQGRFTMPTAAERSGDFSQTVTTTGRLIQILDPTTGKAFPDNRIPANRISPEGFAVLNLFPAPFATDPSGQRQYNAIYQWPLTNVHEDRVLRVDANVGPKTQTYAVLRQDYSSNKGNGVPNGPSGGGWGQLRSFWDLPSVGGSLNVIHTFSPNLINEFKFGFSLALNLAGPVSEEQYATNKLPALKGPDGKPVTLPAIIPGANPINIVPRISFAANNAQTAGQAVTNAPTFGWGAFWPFWSRDKAHNIINNVTWVKRDHRVKLGIYYEHEYRPAPVEGHYMGQYYFGADGGNPTDTGYAYSNALLGSVQSMIQDGARQYWYTTYHQVEGFIQDTWRVNRRVTLDIGVRFQAPGPSGNRGQVMSLFDGATYNRAKSGQLLYPALQNGQRVALNPATGATYSYARVNSFDPASYPAGSIPYSGLIQYKDAFFNWPNVGVGPRLGLAWDVFGDGRTAVRGGWGIMYGRAYNPNLVNGMQKTPPGYQSLTFFNTTIDTLQNTDPTFTPINVLSGSPDYPNPDTYNWSIGIQRDLTRGFILDVAYVGNVAHHMFSSNTFDANAVRPYTTWSPSGGVAKMYQDPTNATGGLYNTNLIRPLSGGYGGFGTINVFSSKGESSYNALQVQVNRRFGSRLQVATNYTWSKTVIFSPQQWVDDNLTKNVVNRPHAVNANFGYQLPDFSRRWGNAVLKQVMDGWNINGVGSMYTGTPLTIGCTAAGVPANLGNYWTGTPTGGVPFRCQMTGDLWLAAGSTPSSAGSTADPRLWYPFAQSSFVLPPANSLGIGSTPPTLTYGPGFFNWDLSVFKEFALGADRARALQFRAETFNTFNHFNPGNPNTSLTYNFQSGAQTNANFGTITTAQNPGRKAVLSLRLRF